MKLKVYAVLDEKAKCFLPPFNAQNNGVAIRMFDGAVKNPETLVSKYPDDYCLYALAEFDDNSGKYVGIEPIERVVKASELVSFIPGSSPASATADYVATVKKELGGKKDGKK